MHTTRGLCVVCSVINTGFSLMGVGVFVEGRAVMPRRFKFAITYRQLRLQARHGGLEVGRVGVVAGVHGLPSFKKERTGALGSRCGHLRPALAVSFDPALPQIT